VNCVKPEKIFGVGSRAGEVAEFKVGGTSPMKTLSESVGEPAVHRLRPLRAASTCRSARSRSEK